MQGPKAGPCVQCCANRLPHGCQFRHSKRGDAQQRVESHGTHVQTHTRECGFYSMLSDFRAWFDCSDHADVLLRLCIDSQPATENSQAAETSNSRKRPRDEEQGVDAPIHSTGPTASAAISSAQQADKAVQQVQQARVYSLHAVLLARHSAWFRTALSKPWQQPACTMQHNDIISGSAASAIRHELSVHVQPDEVEAADLLLRLVYGCDPPALPTDNLPLFFTCLRLADRFDSPDCVDLLLRHIKDATVDISMVRHVYCAPPGVQDHPIHKELQDSCKGAILQLYGIVPSVIRDKQLLQEFCSLPFVAVLAWAESDGLKVQSENCVVYLLNAWVKAAQREGGQGVSKEQLEQLAHQVRVLNLGTAYQHHVLPQLEWFKGCSCMEWLPLALTLVCWQACDGSALKLNKDRPQRSVWKGPKQWMARPRSQHVMTDEDRKLRWEVGGEELQRLYDGKSLRSSTPLCINGFRMSLYIKPLKSKGGAQGMTLGVFPRVYKSQLSGAISSWPKTAGVFVGRIMLRMMGAEETVRPHPMVGTSLRGCSNMLGQSAPTMRELLAPFLRDGKLQVEACYSHVDRKSTL